MGRKVQVPEDWMTRTTVSVPVAGAICGLGPDAAYDAAKRGDFFVLEFGKLKRVPVPWLLRKLQGAREPTD